MLKGSYITTPSPCGANCSYSLSFTGPVFDCVNLDVVNSVSISDHYTGATTNTTQFKKGGSMYSAAENTPRQYPLKSPVDKYVGDTMDLDVYYILANSTTEAAHIKCVTWMANYDVDVSYTEGEQTYAVKTEKKYAIGTPVHARHNNFYTLDDGKFQFAKAKAARPAC